MSRRAQWLVYGATGYTGSRIAEHAAALGMQPVLAGRNADALKALAQRLDLEWRVAQLSDASALRKLVGEFSTVLNTAGPFLHTYEPMVQACLAAGTHYLDLTGEIQVYEALAALHAHARQAQITIMPGVGFDMVPGDRLALHLKRQMPDAIKLDMGISFNGTMTRGTIRSALASFSPDARVRRAHVLTTLTQPLAREFDFGPGACGGRSVAYAMDFGDSSIAWRTTGIANITSYLRPSKEFASIASIRSEADVTCLPDGPSMEELRDLPSVLVAEVSNHGGETLAARLVTPQIYAITFAVAAAIAQRVHRGEWRAGFQTCASVFGEDFILGFDGCELQSCTPRIAPS